MKFVKTLLASAALAASMGASAQVTGMMGGGTGPFLSLSSLGLNGGTFATLSGGTVYHSDQPFADIPAGAIFEDSFLAAGPSSGSTATLTFTTGISYISFLWGSPDLYNSLSVTYTGTTSGTASFTADSLMFPVTNGDQSSSTYVYFTALDGYEITSLSFTNSSAIDAFESANYSITPVPEPETYALMLAGLGAIGFIARRRKKA